MNSELINFKELQSWYGVKHVNAVIERLNADKIKYKLDVDGKPRTTATAVNASFYNENEDWSSFA